MWFISNQYVHVCMQLCNCQSRYLPCVSFNCLNAHGMDSINHIWKNCNQQHSLISYHNMSDNIKAYMGAL